MLHYPSVGEVDGPTEDAFDAQGLPQALHMTSIEIVPVKVAFLDNRHRLSSIAAWSKCWRGLWADRGSLWHSRASTGLAYDGDRNSAGQSRIAGQ